MVIKTPNPEKLFKDVAAAGPHTFSIGSCVNGGAWRYNYRDTSGFVRLIIFQKALGAKLSAFLLLHLQPLYHKRLLYQPVIVKR